MDKIALGNTIYKTEGFQTAESFVEKLVSHTSDAAPPEYRSTWVFRGQSNANWDLKPSAWREDGKAKLLPLMNLLRPKVIAAMDRGSEYRKDWRDNVVEQTIQAVAEVVAVRHFCNLADELGIGIPGADGVLDMDEAIFFGLDYAIGSIHLQDDRPKLFVDIPFAFAQHHGVPTRYLDWTRDGLVAAFFASGDAHGSLEQSNSSPIAVWAIKTAQDAGECVKWINVPRASHHYLHAQHGLFSFLPTAHHYFANQSKWPSLNDILADRGQPHRDGNKPKIQHTEIWQYVLPSTESNRLRQILFDRRISKAHLMPTLDNVAEITRLRWSWYPH